MDGSSVWSEDMQTCFQAHFSGYLLIPRAPFSRQGIINYTVYPLSVVHQLFSDMKIPAVVEQSTSGRAMSVSRSDNTDSTDQIIKTTHYVREEYLSFVLNG